MNKPTNVLPVAQLSSDNMAQLSLEIKHAQQHALWLSIYFPKLALEALSADIALSADTALSANTANQPIAVIEQIKGQRVVHTVSDTAEACGVTPTMLLGACFALCPHLKIFEYDEKIQQTRLIQLAAWAEQFTSRISLYPPRALLLEIGCSLKLFGGLETLLALINDSLARQWQHVFTLSVTPTPLASFLLASSGQTVVVKQKNALRSALGKLPINILPLNEKRKKQLSNIGVRMLRDVWRLPREDLARRFDPQLVNYLDRTLGGLADPHKIFQSPENFEESIELPFEILYNTFILIIARQLARKLVTFLRQRDACIATCFFTLYNNNDLLECIKINMRLPTRDAEHLIELFTEHLNKIKLSAPVTRVKLTAKHILPFATNSAELPITENEHLVLNGNLNGNSTYASKEHLTESKDNIARLLEQLQARLGRQAITELYTLADHRPEYAHYVGQNNRSFMSFTQLTQITQQRPLWLLPDPELIIQKNGKLWWRGPVVVTAGPERIEAGWWSGNDIRRDYYIGINHRGSRLWLYRDLREGLGNDSGSDKGWYLHGLFA